MPREKSEARKEAEYFCMTQPNQGSRTLAKIISENHGIKLESARSMIRNIRGNHGNKSRKEAVAPRKNGRAGEGEKPPRTDLEIAKDKADQLERALLVAKDSERRLRRNNDKLKRELHEKDLEIEDIISSVPAFVPTGMNVRRKTRKSSATAVLCCSDWHYEETIDPRKVNGLNEHNRSISVDRIRSMTGKAIEQIEMFNAVHNIETLVVWLGGDMISGNIHDELLETCELPPAEAIVEVSEVIANMLDTFHRTELFKKIEVVFNDGNHGRATKKIRVATRTGNSWETLMAKMMKVAFRDYKNLDWFIADGDQIIHEVEGRKWRFLHGDSIRYHGGVGGLTIPANKAVKQWNEAVSCYHTVFGHWHTYLRERNWTCNGSSIGYSEFAQRIKAPYEPPQQALIIADRDGIRQNTALQLSKGMV